MKRLKQFFEDIFENSPLEAELYFVSFKNDNGDFTGYYLIYEGELIKKSLYAW